MDLDVTKAFQAQFSGHLPHVGSVAELGPCAAQITWRNALTDAPSLISMSREVAEAARGHFREYGAWSDDEISAWSDDKIEALLLQEVAYVVWECPGMGGGWDWDAYEALCRDGTVSGRIYRSDDERVYFHLGS